MNGLLMFVYRAAGGGDCTNDGVSSKVDTVILIDGKTDVFEPSDRNPAMYLSRWYGRAIATPSPLPPRVRNDRDDCSVEHLDGFMFGGNFLYSSDSRSPGIVYVYDRREDGRKVGVSS